MSDIEKYIHGISPDDLIKAIRRTFSALPEDADPDSAYECLNMLVDEFQALKAITNKLEAENEALKEFIKSIKCQLDIMAAKFEEGK